MLWKSRGVERCSVDWCNKPLKRFQGRKSLAIAPINQELCYVHMHISNAHFTVFIKIVSFAFRHDRYPDICLYKFSNCRPFVKLDDPVWRELLGSQIIFNCLSPLELCQYILAKGVRKHGSEALF